MSTYNELQPAAFAAHAVERRGPGRPIAHRNRVEPCDGAWTRPRWPIVLFLGGLIVPWIIPLGPLNLSVYRIVLLVTILPCLMTWLSGRAGRIRAMDIAMLMYSGWAAATLLMAHGAGGLQPSGILIIETMGAYLLARCYVRSATDFRNVIVLMSAIVILLFPCVIYEWLTGNKPILSAFGTVLPTIEVTQSEPRLGFWRVQGPFAHSIEFGVLCGSVFALTHFVMRGRRTGLRGLRAILVFATAILSMSSAPVAGLLVQAALIAWNRVLGAFRNRWKILAALAFAGYLVVEFGSNQTPVQFYIAYFTFDQQTGWFRLWIWEYGSASVLNHPLFGIGLGDWVRPKWMAPDSIDNFWLLIAVRHGLPALACMFAAFFGMMIAVARQPIHEPKLRDYRLGYLICLGTYLFVGSTVHLWAAGYVWFLFLFGSGAWLLDTRPGDDSVIAPTDRSRRPNMVAPHGLRSPDRSGHPGRRAKSTS